MHMGCYGIGVTRIVAAAIEQNHDERGIIWPAPLAPFDVVLVGLNWEKSERVRERAERALPRARRRRASRCCSTTATRGPGVKFADAELIGIPHRLVVSERGLAAGKLEYRHRRAEANEEFPQAERARLPARARRGRMRRIACEAGAHLRARGRALARPRPAPAARGRPPAGPGPARSHRRGDQGNALLRRQVRRRRLVRADAAARRVAAARAAAGPAARRRRRRRPRSGSCAR